MNESCMFVSSVFAECLFEQPEKATVKTRCDGLLHERRRPTVTGADHQHTGTISALKDLSLTRCGARARAHAQSERERKDTRPNARWVHLKDFNHRGVSRGLL